MTPTCDERWVRPRGPQQLNVSRRRCKCHESWQFSRAFLSSQDLDSIKRSLPGGKLVDSRRLSYTSSEAEKARFVGIIRLAHAKNEHIPVGYAGLHCALAVVSEATLLSFILWL